MTLKLFTLRGKHSGRLYYATGHNFIQACHEISISPNDLILERTEIMPAQTALDIQEPTISSNTVPYHSQRK